MSTLDLVNKRKPRHGLSREFYLDESVYQDDLEQIWYRNWVYAGHCAELPKPGSYITLSVGDYPVVVVNDNGQMRAFHNACRHRGSMLCQERSGRAAKLVCPYHRWTYDYSGQLLFAQDMGDDFIASDWQLMPVAIEVVESLIFICVADEAPDFEPFRQAFQPFLAPHRLGNAKVAHQTETVEKGNWKLVLENNRECYHCQSCHPELVRSFDKELSKAGLLSLAEQPEFVQSFVRETEEAGIPCQTHWDADGQFRMTRMALMNGNLSHTMDGTPAVSKRMDATGRDNLGNLFQFYYPSMWTHFLGDHALTFRVLPKACGETVVTTTWLVNEDAQEGVDYDLENLTRVWNATNQQDREIVENTVRGLRSPAWQPGPYSSILENGTCQFVDWYCEQMRRGLANT